jgi:hypothetical protein
LLPVVFGVLVFKLSVWCWAEGYVSGLRAAAAASNNICNKNHLLHLVGILFPHRILGLYHTSDVLASIQYHNTKPDQPFFCKSLRNLHMPHSHILSVLPSRFRYFT